MICASPSEWPHLAAWGIASQRWEDLTPDAAFAPGPPGLVFSTSKREEASRQTDEPMNRCRLSSGPFQTLFGSFLGPLQALFRPFSGVF